MKVECSYTVLVPYIEQTSTTSMLVSLFFSFHPGESGESALNCESFNIAPNESWFCVRSSAGLCAIKQMVMQGDTVYMDI